MKHFGPLILTYIVLLFFDEGTVSYFTIILIKNYKLKGNFKSIYEFLVFEMSFWESTSGRTISKSVDDL